MKRTPQAGRLMAAAVLFALSGAPPVQAGMPGVDVRTKPVISRPFRHDAPQPSGAGVWQNNTNRTGVMVPQVHYEAVKGMAQELLERFSPQGHYYVLVGHSPGRLASFLDVLGPDLSQTFPASALSGTFRPTEMDSRYADYRTHFEALLPPSVVKGQRKILLVDYTSGPSNENLSHVLRRYLVDVGSSVQVETVGFKPGQGSNDHHLSRVNADANTYAAYDNDELSHFAYSTHKIGQNRLASLKKDTTKFPQRVESYREWMAQDAELDSFLSKHLAEFIE